MTEDTEKDQVGLPPGDERSDIYRATGNVRGGGKGGTGFIWFACKDGGRDRVLQLANLRELEPGTVSGTTAYLHFSGMVVVLDGSDLRQVVYRIFLGRCTSVHELRPGQTPEKPNDPVINSIKFMVPADAAPDKSKPKHEPETERAKH